MRNIEAPKPRRTPQKGRLIVGRKKGVNYRKEEKPPLPPHLQAFHVWWESQYGKETKPYIYRAKRAWTAALEWKYNEDMKKSQEQSI